MTREQTFTPDQIAARLAGLPGWRHGDGVIERTYRTSGWRATLMVVTTIGHLCEAAWHHPDLAVGYDSVTVKLSTHSARGITEKDFALAARIEDVIAWHPSKESGALTGPPAGKAYVIADA